VTEEVAFLDLDTRLDRLAHHVDRTQAVAAKEAQSDLAAVASDIEELAGRVEGRAREAEEQLAGVRYGVVVGCTCMGKHGCTRMGLVLTCMELIGCMGVTCMPASESEHSHAPCIPHN